MVIALAVAVATVALGGVAGPGAAVAQTPTVPGVPANLSVTAGDRQLTADWDAPTDTGGSPIIDYEVEYRPGTGGNWTSTDSYSITYTSTVLNGTDDTRSLDQDPLDLGTPTGGMGGNVQDYIAPEPFAVNNNPSTGLYKVKQAVAALRIQVGGEADVETTIRLMYSATKPASLAFSGTELARVNSSESSETVHPIGLDFIARDLPADSFIWVDGYDRSDDDNDGNLALTATTIGKRRLGVQVVTVSTATETTISGLANQQSYQMRVRARNSVGWGAWSSASGTPVGTPDAPSGLTVQAGARQITVNWTAPANNGGADITDYVIGYQIENAQTWTEWQASTISTATTTTITSLTNGTTYQVRVAAKNTHGTGAYAYGTDTPGKPTRPTLALSSIDGTYDSNKTYKGGELAIALAADGNGAAITDYDLRFRQSDWTNWYTHHDRSHDTKTLSGSDTASRTDPIDYGTAAFTTPTGGGVTITREAVGTNNGFYKFSKFVDQLYVRVRGTLSASGDIKARWGTTKPTAAQLGTAGTEIPLSVDLTITRDTNNNALYKIFADGFVKELPADAYIWFYTTNSATVTERRLQLDFTDNSTNASMLLGGLRNGATYELQARAQSARGWGLWGSASGTAGVPMRPAVNTPTAKHQALDVTWAAPQTDNGSGVVGYDVQYRAGSTGDWEAWTHTTTDRTTTITNLTNNTEYEVQVRARNGRGDGFWSAGVKGTPVPQAPDAPAASTLTSSGTTMTVRWAAPLANGAAIIDYDVAYCSSSCTSESNWTALPDNTNSTALSATITGLTNAVTYQVRVRAQNSVGNGEWSAVSTHTIGRPSAPAAPTLTTGNGQLTATWTAASGNGSAITDYDVAYCSSNCSSDASWTALPDTTPSTALSATIGGLTNGTAYQVRVRAENAAGTGPWSAVSSMKAGLPGVPSALTVTSGDQTLNASWTAPSGHGSEITDYDVRYCSTNCDGGDSFWTEHSRLVGSRSTSAVVGSLTNGTTYEVQVRADNQHGSGAWSPSVSIKAGVPAPPGAPTLTAADGKIVVEWSAPAANGSAITDYDVRYSSNGGSTWKQWDASATSTATLAVVTGLEPLATHQVQVRAVNGSGDGPWSASSSLRLPVSPKPSLVAPTFCDPAGVTQVWVDYSCFIKAGERGIKAFDAVTVLGSGGDYIQKTEFWNVGMVELLAYNPQGGLAIVETSLNGEVQDRFLVDVIQFGIRGRSVTGQLVRSGTFQITVQLHSPDHRSPDKHIGNGSDFARSWAELDLTGAGTDLLGLDHGGNWMQRPKQVVEQYGDSVRFFVYAINAGNHPITLKVFRPQPDSNCPTHGPVRCWTPPTGTLTQTYLVASPVQISAAVAAPPPDAVVSVSNLDETGWTHWCSARPNWHCAQGFTTGPAANGYALESVTASFLDKAGSPGDILATLHASVATTVADGQRPDVDNGTVLATLTGDKPETAGDYTFTCSGMGCTLAPNTTYFVRFSSTAGTDNNNEYRWKWPLNAFGETPTPADNGWSIANELDYRYDHHPWTAATDLTAYLKITATITP